MLRKEKGMTKESYEKAYLINNLIINIEKAQTEIQVKKWFTGIGIQIESVIPEDKRALGLETLFEDFEKQLRKHLQKKKEELEREFAAIKDESEVSDES